MDNVSEDAESGKVRSCLEEQVFVQLQRSADQLRRPVECFLKAAGLSPTQYNVLRILRGAGKAGCSCGEIAERMVTRDPDITRLLDRMETRGLVTRARADNDRRVITTHVTKEGLALLEQLDEPIQALHREQMGHLGRDVLTRLRNLLEKVLVRHSGPRPLPPVQ